LRPPGFEPLLFIAINQLDIRRKLSDNGGEEEHTFWFSGFSGIARMISGNAKIKAAKHS
jgi:hypothetical protein